jgi:hypothetical protein
MNRIVLARPIGICTVFGFGACGGQVVVGGEQPSDGGLQAGERPLDAGSTTGRGPAALPAVNGEAGATLGQTATMAADVYPIDPNTEATLCQVFSNPFGRDVDLVSIEVTSTAEALDVFLFSLAPSGQPVPTTPTALIGCEYDPLGRQPFLYFNHPAQSVLTSQPDTGYPLSAANSLLLRVHYVNVNAATREAQTKVSLGAAMPPVGPFSHVGTIFLTNANFPVDAPNDGGPSIAERSTVPLDQPYTIFASWGFSVPFQTEARASANGTVFFDVTNFFGDSANMRTYSQLLQHDPPIEVGASASIAWSCSYPSKNLAQTGQCVYQGYYYPADPQKPDLIYQTSSTSH